MLKVSYIVNSVFTSRTYILSDGDKQEFWLVDCGDVPPLMDLLSSRGGNSFIIKGVLLTHAHFDHIYGLPELTSLFPQVRVYTNLAGREILANPRQNMSKYHGNPIGYESDSIVVCEEGDTIDLFDGVSVMVYSTPGHNPSCLCYDTGQYLFTGDSYIPGLSVVTTLPGANKELAENSLERIQLLAAGKTVCPGHEV